MKKLYISLVVLSFFTLPLTVFAAVNVTLSDTSTEEVNTIQLDIDTETDTLEKVALPIRFSEGVSITEIIPGSVECPILEYSEGSENTIVVNCELEEAMALEGILASISFTTAGENYSFSLLEDDENLEIGTLSLGDIVNIGEAAPVETTEIAQEESVAQDSTLPPEQDIPTTTQEEPQQELSADPTDDSFTLNSITEYLPYILIAASVILLISIIAILLGKKKEPKKPKKTSKAPPRRESPQPPVQEQSSQEEPTLKSMVNSLDSNKTQHSAPPQQSTVSQQPPRAQQPPVTPQQAAYTQPQQEQPPIQKSASPNIPPKTQDEDLQEILNREVRNSQREEGHTPAQPTPQPTVQPSGEPRLEQIHSQPEIPVSDNLNMNTQPPAVNNAPPTEPRAKIPNEIPTKAQRPPVSEETLQQEIDENISRLKTNNPPTPEYPAVPPSAPQPQSQPNQTPPTTVQPEEIPTVPPAV